MIIFSEIQKTWFFANLENIAPLETGYSEDDFTKSGSPKGGTLSQRVQDDHFLTVAEKSIDDSKSDFHESWKNGYW